jgi:hypothetical protein
VCVCVCVCVLLLLLLLLLLFYLLKKSFNFVLLSYVIVAVFFVVIDVV